MEQATQDVLEKYAIITPDMKKNIREMYSAALQNTNLEIIDFMTIRDLLRLSSYDDPEIHALLICMFMSFRNGSVCCSAVVEHLAQKISFFSPEKAPALAKKIAGGLHCYPELIHISDRQALLFENPEESYRPIILERTESGQFLYFQKYHFFEKSLTISLTAHLKQDPLPFAKQKIKNIIDEVLRKNPVLINNQPISFNSAQILAAVLPLVQNCVIISGGPGTGKTSVVVNQLRALLRMGVDADRIKIAAPTGRAARKLTEAITRSIASIKKPSPEDLQLLHCTGTTIHRLLRFSPSKNIFLHDAYNRLDADLIVIDEVSMVDIMLLSSLLEAMPENGKIIFLGDRNQLPSVEAGSVLADLIPDTRRMHFSDEILDLIQTIIPDQSAISQLSEKGHKGLLTDRIVLLTENYRSEQSIKNAARAINEQDLDIVSKISLINLNEYINAQKAIVSGRPINQGSQESVFIPQAGIHKIQQGLTGLEKYSELHFVLDAWVRSHYFQNNIAGKPFSDLFSWASDCEIDDIHSGDNHDKLMLLFQTLDSIKILSPLNRGAFGAEGINRYIINVFCEHFKTPARHGFIPGMPIVMTRNDYSKELYNGDTGILVGKGDRMFCVFNTLGTVSVYPVERLESFEPAFAITVHKSQGSEYDHILFIVPELTSKTLLTREILYTGITRAKKSIILFASDNVLGHAIQNRIERESGMGIV